MSNLGIYYIKMLEIVQRKLSKKSNGHDFTLGSSILRHIISSRSKLNNGCVFGFSLGGPQMTIESKALNSYFSQNVHRNVCMVNLTLNLASLALK